MRPIYFFSMLCTMLLLIGARVVNARQDERINYNQTVQGQLGDAHVEDLWQFTGQAGDLILINMQSRSADNLDTYLTLANNRGNVLTTDDDGGEGFNSRIGPFQLPDDGTYQITAASYSGSGEYILQLVNLRTRPYLTPGKPLVGLVEQDQPTEYFLLRSEDDSLFRLAATDDDSFSDPILTVYDLEGLITTTEYQPTSEIDPLVTVPDQSYVIVVSYNPAGEGSPYEITLTPSEVELLEDGVTQGGELDYLNYTGQHYFHAETGDRILLTVTTTGGTITPALEVQSTDYDYAIFSSEGKSIRELSIEFEVPASTVYSITVYDSSYEAGEGAYEVTVEWVE